jgi:hypothetical protein
MKRLTVADCAKLYAKTGGDPTIAALNIAGNIVNRGDNGKDKTSFENTCVSTTLGAMAACGFMPAPVKYACGNAKDLVKKGGYLEKMGFVRIATKDAPDYKYIVAIYTLGKYGHVEFGAGKWGTGCGWLSSNWKIDEYDDGKCARINHASTSGNGWQIWGTKLVKWF